MLVPKFSWQFPVINEALEGMDSCYKFNPLAQYQRKPLALPTKPFLRNEDYIKSIVLGIRIG
ncbi:MAG: hypothetical protein DCF25_15470 [Leptolyngbya foveolarum]|uniref:Uncharacterized protein n=1 Tax=Leptolyngbya foveolarum TaxID=47253 RepID=A0A2W4U4G3_9CYAN|nr:MAG: hypothetical protein DCF25_15470 [Leptolyngbya foveolarum]